MKPLLKSSYTFYAVSLTFITALIVLIAFLPSFTLMSKITNDLAGIVKWELVLSNSTVGQAEAIQQMGTQALGVHEVVIDVKELSSRLNASGIVRDSVIAEGYIVVFKGANLSRNYRMVYDLNGTQVLVVDGLGSSAYVVWSARYLPNSSRILKELHLRNANLSDAEAIRLKELIMYSSELPSTYTHTYTGAPLIIAVNSRDAESMIPELVKELLSLASPSGARAYLYRVGPVLLIDLKPQSYITPTSLTSTYMRVQSVGEALAKQLHLRNFYTPEIDEKLGTLLSMEPLTKYIIAFTLVIPVTALAVGAGPLAESAVVSTRRYMSLLRLRGLSSQIFRRWIALTTPIYVITGFLIAAITLLALSALGGDEASSVRILLDPYVVASALIASLIAQSLMSRKTARLYEVLSPQEAMRNIFQGRVPSDISRIGKTVWVSLALGTAFILEGFTGASASGLLANAPVGGIPAGAVVLLVILALIEFFLKPFTPILIAYGAGALLGAYMGWIAGLLGRVIGRVDLQKVVKALAALTGRRSGVVALLTIFSVALLIQSFMAQSSMQGSIHMALQTSIGAPVSGMRTYSLTSIEELPELASQLASATDGNGAVLLSLNMLSESKIKNSSIVNVVILLDPGKFLRTAYWIDGWGLGGSFRDCIMSVTREGVATAYVDYTTRSGSLSSRALLKTLPLGLPLANVTVKGFVNGFPAAPQLNARRGATLIVGPWIINDFIKLEKAASLNVGEQPTVFQVRAVILSRDPSIIPMLEGEGFTVKSLEEIESSPRFNSLVDLVSAYAGVMPSTAVYGLSILASTLIAWSVGRESFKTQVLLRIRGLRRGKVLMAVTLYWAVISLTSVGVGMLAGLSAALSLDSTGFEGGLVRSLLTSYALSMGVDLRLAPPTSTIPSVMLIASLIAIVLMTLIPSALTFLAFKGSTRERLMEVG